MWILIFSAVLAALIFLALKLIYDRFWASGLHTEISFKEPHVFCGEEATLIETVSNDKPLPLPVLEINFSMNRYLIFSGGENSSVSDMSYRRDVFSLGPRQRITRSLPVLCTKRGIYEINGAGLASDDLLLRYKYLMSVPVFTELCVLPGRISSNRINIPFSKIMGELLSRRKIYDDPFEFSGIREYMLGDPMKYINWKASARTGDLLVNTHESTLSQSVVFLIDMEESSARRENELNEEAVRVAASLCERLLLSGISVSVLSNGTDIKSGGLFSDLNVSGINSPLALKKRLACIEGGKNLVSPAELMKARNSKEGSLFVLLSRRQETGFLAHLEALAYLHCALFFTPIYATIAFLLTGQDEASVALYCLRGFLIVIPAALSELLMKKLPSLWQVLLAVILLCALTALLFWNPFVPIFTVIMCLLRGGVRLSEEKTDCILDAPHLAMAIIYILPFAVSAIYDFHSLQSACIILTVCYFIVWFVYYGLLRIERYISLNAAMKNLPARRIKRISGAALCVVTALTAALLFSAALRTSFVKIDPYTPNVSSPVSSEIAEAPPAMDNSGLSELLAGAEQNEPLVPEFVWDILFALLAAGVAALLIFLAYKFFRTFRSSYNDNGDKIETITSDENSATERLAKKRGQLSMLDFSPNARVRKKYKKTVLRRSKEKPAPSLTPAEIECAAPLPDSPETKRLHNLYEKARYSEKGVSREDTAREE